MKTALGILIVVAHLGGFMWLAQRSRGTELAIPAPVLAVASGSGGPGLVHAQVSESFRGGHVRTVGSTQLVGPFQDPAHLACSGRVVIGQALLDPIATLMKQTLDHELHGESIWPIGDYKRVKSLVLEWVKEDITLRERRMLGKAGAPDGFVRAKATVEFARVDVPVHVALVPERTSGQLKFRIAAEADLDFDNRLLDWVSDKLNADELATRIARQQISDVLVTSFAPPPPFELSEGQTLQFTYCDEPVEIVDSTYGALPFAVAIGTVAGSPGVLPPHFPRGTRLPPARTTPLAIDLDVDALDALLFELWRSGWLDRRLAEVGLDRRFNADPIVTEYLSIRLSPLHFALPPVIAPGTKGGLRLAADARVSIADGGHPTMGRVFGALDFTFAHGSSTELPTQVDIGALDLSCERDPQTLVPCYGDLVDALRGRGKEFHGALTDAFAKILADIFVDRHVGAEGLPAEIVIDRAVPTLATGGTLHLDLFGKLAPPP